MRRKILMGVLALALPAGTMAVLSPAASAKAPDNPIACSGFSGTVNFPTPLTTAGVPTANKVGGATTVTGVGGTCGTHALTASGLNITGSKNTKLLKTDPNYNKTTGVKYVQGKWSEFASAGGSLKKTLKVINFSIGGAATAFKTKSSNIVIGGTCGSAVGFQLNGQVKSGTYADKSAVILACLTGDGGGSASGNFGADYLSAQGVSFATIGGASNATL